MDQGECVRERKLDIFLIIDDERGDFDELELNRKKMCVMKIISENTRDYSL